MSYLFPTQKSKASQSEQIPAEDEFRREIVQPQNTLRHRHRRPVAGHFIDAFYRDFPALQTAETRSRCGGDYGDVIDVF